MSYYPLTFCAFSGSHLSTKPFLIAICKPRASSCQQSLNNQTPTPKPNKNPSILHTPPHTFSSLPTFYRFTLLLNMAFTSLILILFGSFCLILRTQAQAQAPAPSSGAVDLVAILQKGGQYTTLIRLLNDSQQLTQIQSQLKSNSQGFTLFAPTDNAFQNLKSGALNHLSDEQKVQLILYHVTPKYYSLADLLTVSNPVRTQASGSDGSWGLNFTGQGNQVNVSSGVVETQVNNALRQQFPLAVYQVDKVLLPEELFGEKSPAAPSPKSPKSSPETTTVGKAGGAPSPSSEGQKDNGAAERNVGFGVILGVGLICMGALS
ncbi:hypothetical protein VNO80_27322 [Phaseolus coccineus]|uniref:FAS1 domain-containing protein n=1 Tax=Phaseolus coccineus TaxID=3886 RepID=A0AAN9LJS3_PHACN